MVAKAFPWFLCALLTCAAEITEKKYASMPQLFHQDNFDHCMMYGDEALFCSVQYELQPINPRKPPESWKVIQEVNSDPFNYRHDKLRQWICVRDSCPNITATDSDDPTLKSAINACYDAKYKQLGYKGTITQITCETNNPRYPVNLWDILYGIIILGYVGLVLYGTYFEAMAACQPQEEYNKITNTRNGQILTAFSIKKNWVRLVTVNSTPDVEKLRCIQGIRVYNMALVILSHTAMTFILIPVSNTRYTETMIEKSATVFLASGPLCVCTFFVISSFLLSYGLFDYFKDKKEINFKFLILAFVNRYIRLTPTLIVMVGFHATWLRHLGSGPFWNSIANQEYLRCRNNWWTNILYINNIVNRSEMCLQTTWYLALDTQYFAGLLLLLWLVKKYERHIWLILGFFLTLNIIGTFSENYIFGFSALHLPKAESVYMMHNTITDIQWHHQLASIIGNVAPPIVGIGYGYIFYKYRNRKIFDNQTKIYAWWIGAWVVALGVTIIPGLLVLHKSGEPKPFWASLHVATSRPVFAAAIGLLIIGFAEGLGGLGKAAVEWRPTYVLGRLTYTSYLVHMPLVLLRPAIARYSIYITDYSIVTTLFGDLMTTYFAATILTLFLEMPVSELQKILVPQKSNKSQNENKSKVEELKSK